MKDKGSEKSKNYNKLIIISLVIVLVLIIVDLLIQYVPWKNLFEKEVITTNKTDVTITDTGLGESVEKLYDATVIVKVSAGNASGWGSGVVYDTDDNYAYLLTNNHVVEDANTITIVFTDETEVTGELVGTDEISDIAVVKVPKDSIKAVCEIGDSSTLKLGDTTFAIGTPISLTYSFTITRGIVSGQNRLVEMTSSSSNSYYGFYGSYNSESWYMNLIQTDAAVNAGNSGGPLANVNGQVIGIINSKLSSSSGYSSSSSSIESMGFAIPIEDALNVAEQLRENGKVKRPVLGVAFSVPRTSYYSQTTETTNGAVIAEVNSGSSADKAGLKAGDIITKLGDYKVKDYKYLKYYLYRYKVGDKVEVTYTRDGKENTTTITLQES